jgi:ferritin
MSGERMEKDLTALINESMNLELNVAELYLMFHDLFPEDAAFWWNLVVEEKNHAALFRSGEELFLSRSKFPVDLVRGPLQDLIDKNRELSSLIEEYERNPPSREEAFNIALSIENSAGELHFQRFMDKDPGSRMGEIFQQLNQDDKDHVEKISSYMKCNNVRVESRIAKETSQNPH